MGWILNAWFERERGDRQLRAGRGFDSGRGQRLVWRRDTRRGDPGEECGDRSGAESGDGRIGALRSGGAGGGTLCSAGGKGGLSQRREDGDFAGARPARIRGFGASSGRCATDRESGSGAYRGCYYDGGYFGFGRRAAGEGTSAEWAQLRSADDPQSGDGELHFTARGGNRDV